MRFTEYFAVERDHNDDWFDCELSTDTPLYVDPFLVFEDEDSAGLRRARPSSTSLASPSASWTLPAAT
jgi:hypothetical protein